MDTSGNPRGCHGRGLVVMRIVRSVDVDAVALIVGELLSVLRDWPLWCRR